MSFLLYYLICLVIDGIYSKYPDKKVVISYNDTDEMTTILNLDTTRMPVYFNAISKWGNLCPSLSEIKNQGRCRSGWAIAIADVITDRRCIFLEGKPELPLSSMMLLTCCPNCCGCGGGNIMNAWTFVRDMGLLSGSMNSDKDHLQFNDGCQPYLLKPLKKTDIYKSSTQCLQTPVCIKTKCTNTNYLPTAKDPTSLFKIESFRLLSRAQPEKIMRELIKNGPIQVSFHLYQDFMEYKMIDGICPIYTHHWGKYEGDHAAKLIGWGTDKDIKYWLLSNSFGYFWGCNGTFKISRSGIDNTDFGYAIVAPNVLKNSSSLPVIVINNFYWTILISFLYYTFN